jgi:hypothetical protein
MTRLVCATILGSVIVVSSSFAQDATPPDLAAALARAAEYATTYSRTVPLLAADERANDVLRGFGVQSSDTPGMEQAGETQVRLMRGLIVMASQDNEKGWRAYRDIYEVNNRGLHDTRERLERILIDSSPAALAQATTITNESRRQYVGSVPRAFNVPTFALMFLFPGNQPRFAFRKTGEKKVDAERVWVVAYSETATPTLMATSNGEDYPIHGELWIEPASGRVVKTKMIVENVKPARGSQADAERYRPRITIDVTYRADATLSVWVPVEMKELYEKATEKVVGTATYSNFRRITPKQ